MAFLSCLEHCKFNPYGSDQTEDVSDLYACSITGGVDTGINQFGHFSFQCAIRVNFCSFDCAKTWNLTVSEPNISVIFLKIFVHVFFLCVCVCRSSIGFRFQYFLIFFASLS